LVALSETVVLVSAATLAPLLVGVYGGYLLRGNPVKASVPLLTAISAGVISWFFLDVMGDSALLGISQGLGGGASHLLLVLLFPVGLFIMISLESRSKTRNVLSPVYLAALAVGFHGVAEGIVIGSGLSPASDVFAAIGGVTVAESFVLHKALEGFAISIFLGGQKVYAKATTAVLVAGFPTILGALIGFGFSPDSSYFFALGGGAALWLLTVLVQKSMLLTNRTVWAMAILLGFLLLYSAGLLHSV
jgi:hypothetical protein